MSVPELTCKELVEVVTDYLEGSMPAEQRLLFEEHLAFCDWCQRYLEQLRATIRLTGTLREDDLTPEAQDGLPVRASPSDPRVPRPFMIGPSG
jgi:anti-sigma factor RsiW